MTTANRTLKDAVQQAAGTFGKDVVAIMYCTVDSVDEQNKTCDCTPITGLSDALIPGVLLNSESNDGFTLIPDVGSTIIIGVSKTSKAFMILAEDLSKILLVIGNSKLEVVDGLFKFNDGTNDGMVLVSALVNKLNAVENKLNALLTSYNSHTHPGVQAGSGSSGTTAMPVTGTLTPTQKSDIENIKIKQ